MRFPNEPNGQAMVQNAVSPAQILECRNPTASPGAQQTVPKNSNSARQLFTQMEMCPAAKELALWAIVLFDYDFE